MAGVTFVVVSRRGLSQHWVTAAIDQRQTGDSAQYNQGRPCAPPSLTFFRTLCFSPFPSSIPGFTHFILYIHMHICSRSPFVSSSLYCLSCFSPLSICLPSALHLQFFFSFQLSTLIFILPPWLDHRWFKIHTYLCTQTSVKKTNKKNPCFITSAPPWGKGEKVKVGHIWACSKRNKKETLFSYNTPSHNNNTSML